MAVIAPCITAIEPHEYREQIERVAPFATRLHIDCMDGEFAPTTSPNLIQTWWPDDIEADLHLMYQRPLEHVETVISFKPHLVIVHAEADGGFYDFASQLRAVHIKTGVALLKDTPVAVIADALDAIDHVLVFSGDLGYFGGKADLGLLDKVRQLKQLKPDLEIGWDGGVNDQNAKQLLDAGVDVLNTGGYIQKADNPAQAYATLELIVRQTDIK